MVTLGDLQERHQLKTKLTESFYWETFSPKVSLELFLNISKRRSRNGNSLHSLIRIRALDIRFQSREGVLYQVIYLVLYCWVYSGVKVPLVCSILYSNAWWVKVMDLPYRECLIEAPQAYSYALLVKRSKRVWELIVLTHLRQSYSNSHLSIMRIRELI